MDGGRCVQLTCGPAATRDGRAHGGSSVVRRFNQGGAWADMLLVDGDPTKEIDVLRDYERNFVVIIKGGTIYKNTLD